MQRKLLRNYEGDLMRTHSNGRYAISTGHLLYPGKASSYGSRLHSDIF